MIKLQHPKKEKYDLGKGCIYFVTAGKDDNYQVYRCLEDDEINDYEEIVNCQGEKCVFVHNFPSYELAEAAIISYWHAQEAIVLDVNEFGFMYRNKSGIKCDTTNMQLSGRYILAKKNYGNFEKNTKYLIRKNDCSELLVLNEPRLAAMDYTNDFEYMCAEFLCNELVPVEKLTDGTFELIGGWENEGK